MVDSNQPHDFFAYLREVGDSLIKVLGRVNPRQRVAEEYRCEHESVQEGSEYGDGIPVEDEWGQKRVDYLPHDVAVGDCDRVCHQSLPLVARCRCRRG